MLHIDIAFVGKEPGQVAQYFLNHRLKLRPQRPQPLSTFLMEQVCRLVLSKDELFVSVELLDHLYLHGQGRKRNVDGRHIFEVNTFDDATSRKLLDFLYVRFILEKVEQVFAGQRTFWFNLNFDQIR